MTLRRTLLSCALLALILIPALRVSRVDAQRRVPPPPRWVADNTLWPAQYVPYVSSAGASSITLECAPYPTASPRLLRCTASGRALTVERLAAPYAALLASTRPGELERGLAAAQRRECGPEARPLERSQPSWPAARRDGLRRYNEQIRALRGHLCHSCSGPACRDVVEAVATEISGAVCSFEMEEHVFDLTPTGAMRWGSESLDPACGGRLVHSLRAEGSNWVYQRTRQYDEDAPRLESAPASCADTEAVTMRTDLPLYADVSMCTVLRL